MPVDRGTIDEQLRDIGEGDRWWEQREFRDLPHILQPDERIHGLTIGRLVRPRRPRPRARPAAGWLLVTTNERLICLRQERFGRKQVDIRLAEVTGIRHQTRLRTAVITIDAANRRHRFRLRKSDVFRFLGALAPFVPKPAASASRNGTSWLPGTAAVTAIPRLAELVSRSGIWPAPDSVTHAELARVEDTVVRLEKEVEQLQEHVEFLEELLRQRAGEPLALARPPAETASS